MTTPQNPRIGSSLDDLLAEDGTLDEVTTRAIKRVLAWQLAEAMEAQNLTKTLMSERMGTSRAAVDRLLDPTNTSVTLASMAKAAAAVGKRVRIELVDA